jgi:uncharacterized membrane protein
MRTCSALVTILLLTACTSPERANETSVVNDGNDVDEMVAIEAPPPSEIVTSNQSQPAAEHVSACKLQDGVRVNAAAVKALGTEPFWAARTDGRCITYSTPEDQTGTRVWGKVEISSQETVWTGALRGKPFRLSVKPDSDCSDGMSDKEYPMEAELSVDGETRNGCAEPL